MFNIEYNCYVVIDLKVTELKKEHIGQIYSHEGKSIQYKGHENVTPIDVVKIKFKDFKEYYSITRNKKVL